MWHWSFFQNSLREFRRLHELHTLNLVELKQYKTKLNHFWNNRRTSSTISRTNAMQSTNFSWTEIGVCNSCNYSNSAKEFWKNPTDAYLSPIVCVIAFTQLKIVNIYLVVYWWLFCHLQDILNICTFPNTCSTTGKTMARNQINQYKTLTLYLHLVLCRVLLLLYLLLFLQGTKKVKTLLRALWIIGQTNRLDPVEKLYSRHNLFVWPTLVWCRALQWKFNIRWLWWTQNSQH